MGTRMVDPRTCPSYHHKQQLPGPLQSNAQSSLTCIENTEAP